MKTDNPFDADISDIPGLNPGEEVEVPEADYGPKPEGEYHVKVDGVAVKENSKGTGMLLKVEFEILQPSKYSGDKLIYQMNIQHESKEAQEIGQNQYNSMLLSLGFNSQPESFKKIIGSECFVIMRHREYTWDGEDRIDEAIKRTTPVDGQPQGPFDDENSGSSSETPNDSLEGDDVPF